MPIQYTSRTTSFPKGVMLTHLNTLRDAFHVGERLNRRAGDRYFSARPLFHVAGTALSLLVAVEASACYLTTPNFEPAYVASAGRAALQAHLWNETMFLMMMAHPTFRFADSLARRLGGRQPIRHAVDP